MTQLARRVILSAANDIEIARGVILPAGSYEGMERQTGIELIDRTRWREPEFKIEFIADQLASIGGPSTASLRSEYDVTTFVRGGRLAVTIPK